MSWSRVLTNYVRSSFTYVQYRTVVNIGTYWVLTYYVVLVASYSYLLTRSVPGTKYKWRYRRSYSQSQCASTGLYHKVDMLPFHVQGMDTHTVTTVSTVAIMTFRRMLPDPTLLRKQIPDANVIQ